MSKHTCKRKQKYEDLETANIAARHLRKKHGLSRRSGEISVYLCEHCHWLHVGATLTDEQRKDSRTLAARWAKVQEQRARAAADG